MIIINTYVCNVTFNLTQFLQIFSQILVKKPSFYLNILYQTFTIISNDYEIDTEANLKRLDLFIYSVMKWIRSFRILGSKYSFTGFIKYIEFYFKNIIKITPLSTFIYYLEIWCINIFSPLLLYQINNISLIPTKELTIYSISHIYWLVMSLNNFTHLYLDNIIDVLLCHLHNFLSNIFPHDIYNSIYILLILILIFIIEDNIKVFICCYQVVGLLIVNNFGIIYNNNYYYYIIYIYRSSLL